MFHKRFSTLILLIAVLSLVGCGYSGDESGSMADKDYAEMEPGLAPAEPATDYDTGSGWTDDQTISYNHAQVQERLIIRDAELSIVVDDTEETISSIEALVSDMGGWVVNSNAYQYSDYKRGSISVRIPVEELDTFLDEIRSLANEVTSQSVSGQDVTEEYVDLQAQLTNLQATADRVRAFLDEARNVEEALEVNVELSRLEGDIERITARMNYLEGSARFSAVSIDITPDELNQPVQIGKWEPVGTAKDAIEALINALQWLIDLLIFVVLFLLPILLIFFGPIYLLLRWLRKRGANKKAPVEE